MTDETTLEQASAHVSEAFFIQLVSPITLPAYKRQPAITVAAGTLVPLVRVVQKKTERFPYICAIPGRPFFVVGRQHKIVIERVHENTEDELQSELPEDRG